MSTQTFRATGLTCGHCAMATKNEIEALEGAGPVSVDVVNGGVSTITVEGGRELTTDEVREALDEAGGYQLAE